MTNWKWLYEWIHLRERKCLQICSYSLSQGCILYWVSQENKYHILMQSSSACVTHITFFPPYLDYRSEQQRLKIAVVRARGPLSHCNFQKCGLWPQNFLRECFIVNWTHLCETWGDFYKVGQASWRVSACFLWLYKHLNSTLLFCAPLWLTAYSSGKYMAEMNKTENSHPTAAILSASPFREDKPI